jgi:hypothetical protein
MMFHNCTIFRTQSKNRIETISYIHIIAPKRIFAKKGKVYEKYPLVQAAKMCQNILQRLFT